MPEFSDFFNDRSFVFQYVQGTYRNMPLPLTVRKEYMLLTVHAPRPLDLWLDNIFTDAVGIQIVHATLKRVKSDLWRMDYKDHAERVFIRDRTQENTYRDESSDDAIKFSQNGLIAGLVSTNLPAFKRAYGKYLLKTLGAPIDESAVYAGDMEHARGHYTCDPEDAHHKDYRDIALGRMTYNVH